MSQKNPSSFFSLSSLGFFVALGLITSTLIFSKSFERIKLSNQTITVKGLATQNIQADLGIWNGGFLVQGKTLEEAYALYEATEVKVLDHLTSLGIDLTQLKRSPVYHSHFFQRNEQGQPTEEISHFQVSRSYTYKEKDIKIISRLSELYPELLKKGVRTTGNNAQYLYTKLDDIKSDLLGNAAQDAFQRAQRLAEKTGSKVGLLNSARQGVFQVTPENSQDVSDYGYSDTNFINKTAKAIVTMSFSLQKAG